MSRLLETLRLLSDLPGVSGTEEPVRLAVMDLIDGHASSVEADSLGNLLVFKKGRAAPKNKVLFSAHMDEVGFIITHIEDSGLLRFSSVGGLDSRVVLGKGVEIGPDRVPGVIGGKAAHHQSESERETPPSLDKLFIDIGAESKEEAEGLITPGDRAIFSSPWLEFGDGGILARALDDRAGCALMVELIRSDLPYDCYFAFTVQEETGCAGAVAAGYTVAPDISIVLEATTASDLAGISPDKQVCHQGQGPVLSFMDKGTVYDTELFRLGMETAKKAGIPAQAKTAVTGGNESSAMQVARNGVRTLAVSLPCRYIHSPLCMLRASDLEDTGRYLPALLNAVANL